MELTREEIQRFLNRYLEKLRFYTEVEPKIGEMLREEETKKGLQVNLPRKVRKIRG